MAKDRQEYLNDYGQGGGSFLEQAVDTGQQWNDEHEKGGFWAGVGDFIGNVWDDITGKNAQEREFAQQEYLRDKQNEYDSPAAQMARMKAAGINPHTAAGGIAGGNISQAAPQVASPTPLGNPLDTAAKVGSSSAGAFKNIADGIASFAKLPSELKNIDSDTGLKDSMTFLTDTQRVGLEIDNKYKDPLNQAELNMRNQQIENMKKQYDLIDNQRKYIEKQLDWYDEEIQAEIDLSKKRTLEAEKNAFKLEQEGKVKELEKNFKDEYKFSQFSNSDIAAFSIWEKCYKSGDFTEFEEFNNKYYEFLKSREFNIEKGRQEAITEEAFNQAWNEAAGRQQIDMQNAEYVGMLDLFKEFFLESFKIANRPSDAGGDLLTNLINKFFNEFGKLCQLNSWKVKYPKIPEIKDPKSSRNVGSVDE